MTNRVDPTQPMWLSDGTPMGYLYDSGNYFSAQFAEPIYDEQSWNETAAREQGKYYQGYVYYFLKSSGKPRWCSRMKGVPYVTNTPPEAEKSPFYVGLIDKDGRLVDNKDNNKE